MLDDRKDNRVDPACVIWRNKKTRRASYAVTLYTKQNVEQLKGVFAYLFKVSEILIPNLILICFQDIEVNKHAAKWFPLLESGVRQIAGDDDEAGSKYIITLPIPQEIIEMARNENKKCKLRPFISSIEQIRTSEVLGSSSSTGIKNNVISKETKNERIIEHNTTRGNQKLARIPRKKSLRTYAKSSTEAETAPRAEVKKEPQSNKVPKDYFRETAVTQNQNRNAARRNSKRTIDQISRTQKQVSEKYHRSKKIKIETLDISDLEVVHNLKIKRRKLIRFANEKEKCRIYPYL